MMGNRRTNEKDQPPTSANPPMQANCNAPNIHLTQSPIFQEGNVSAGFFEPMQDPSLFIAPGWENVYSMNHGHNAISASGIPETSGNPMAYLMNPSSFQNPQINLNSITANTELPEVSLLPEWNTRWSPQFINQGGHNAISAGGMNDVASISNFENPWSSKNPTTARNFSGDLLMNNRQTGEPKLVPSNRPQFDPGSIHSPLHYFPRDTTPVHTPNNANFNTSQCGVQGKVERSFLSLGIGGNEEAIPSSHTNTREISSKLKEAASAELKMARARKAMGQNLETNFTVTGFHRNTSGFSSPLIRMNRLTSTSNEVGVHCTPNSGPGSSPYHMIEMQQNDMQHGISRHDDSNSTFQSNRNTVYGVANHHRAFVGNQAVHSGTLGGNSAQFNNSQPNSLNRGMSHTPSGQLQNIRFRTANNLPSQSSMNSPLKLGSSSTRQNYVVNQGKHPILQNDMATQNLEGSLFSQKTPVPQVSWVSSGEGASDLPFPKRLGVEFNGRGSPQVAVAPRATSLQTTNSSQTCQVPNRASTRLPDSVLGGAPVNSPLNSQEPFFTHGQSQGPPPSSVYVRPFHKRSAVTPPPSAPHWVQRQKMTHVTHPTVHHSNSMPTKPTTQSPAHPVAAPINPSRPNFRPSVPVKTAPAISHIKWKEPETSPQLTKYKCLLCKRDLSLTSEGAVYQPTIPPAVAVLPCGHTFHDECLQKITPQDQAKDPPCIPCAIGEN